MVRNSLALSSNGEVLVVGMQVAEPEGEEWTNFDKGAVRVYQYKNSMWTKIGNTIQGKM